MGAIDIAQHGYPASAILEHYFPETSVETVVASAHKGTAPNAVHNIALTVTAGMGAHAAR